MNAEQQQQQQQQPHHSQKSQHHQDHHHHQQHNQEQLQQHHHGYCSYEKDIVCNEGQPPLEHMQEPPAPPTQPQPPQPQTHDEQQQQHSHCHTHMSGGYGEQQPPPPPHRPHHQALPRKHTHSHHTSPHSRHTSPHSRHTSPHSHHSHSQHSSPHLTHYHTHEHGASATCDSLPRSQPHAAHKRPSEGGQSTTHHHAPTGSNSHGHHHHRRRSRRQLVHQHSGGSGSGGSHGGRTAEGYLPHHGRHGGHEAGCARRHRSVSSTSVNTCHDPACNEIDREVQEIFVSKKCCSTSSRAELAQYFAEDLYGSSSRRPSSCCTSSDYCYHTDSTSLYGSRSSLSRNNSIKSASALVRKRRGTQRHTGGGYNSMSLRALNARSPERNGQHASLGSVFERPLKMRHTRDHSDRNGGGGGKMVLSPSKVTIERQTSRDALSNDLPDYACSPSPIRWSFLADGKSPTEFSGGGPTGHQHHHQQQPNRQLEQSTSKDPPWRSPLPEGKFERQPSRRARSGERRNHARPPHGTWKKSNSQEERTASAGMPSALACSTMPKPPHTRRRRGSTFSCDFEEASTTTVLFHQEGEPYNNCCSNYIQCNTYLDQDLQITSEDIHQYLSKGNQQSANGDVLNNSKNYPFQPSNALEFQYKNNFSNNNAGAGAAGVAGISTASEGGDSLRGGVTFDNDRCRRNCGKDTNLGHSKGCSGAASGGGGGRCAGAMRDESSACSTPLSPTNINLSSSTNNINIVFNSSTCAQRNGNEVKFINTARSRSDTRDGGACADTTEVVSSEAHHSGYLPYTYPTYDYANMSANSLFDKPLGIDQLPKEFVLGPEATANAAAHSHVLHESPSKCGASFESFDAPSSRQLLSQRGSLQMSTPQSPLSPSSLAASSPCLSASINPAGGGSYGPCNVANCDYQMQPLQRAPTQEPQHHQLHGRHHSPAHHLSSGSAVGRHHHHHHHNAEGFKIGNALKNVRKRARKYTDFLRKK